MRCSQHWLLFWTLKCRCSHIKSWHTKLQRDLSLSGGLEFFPRLFTIKRRPEWYIISVSKCARLTTLFYVSLHRNCICDEQTALTQPELSSVNTWTFFPKLEREFYVWISRRFCLTEWYGGWVSSILFPSKVVSDFGHLRFWHCSVAGILVLGSSKFWALSASDVMWSEALSECSAPRKNQVGLSQLGTENKRPLLCAYWW